jgi:hypothetical protein
MAGETAKPPLFFNEPSDDREFSRKISLIVRELLDGKINTVETVTLTPGSTETKLVRARASVLTVALLSPKTQSAAAAVAAGAIFYTSTKGEVTIHHDSQPAADRTFGVVLLG